MSEPIVGAMSVPLSAQVRQVIEFLRANVGENAALTLQWDRTGASSLPLFGGKKDQWTALNLFGRMGEFSASCPSSKLPVTEASCMYRVIGDDLELTPKVLIKGFAAKLAPASSGAVGAAEPVGFSAMAILTVFQFAAGLWQLLHPSITVELPGNMEMSVVLNGEAITVDFARMPSVHVSAWFHLDLRVAKATVNPNNAHLDFSPAENAGFFSRFVQSRDVRLT